MASLSDQFERLGVVIKWWFGCCRAASRRFWVWFLMLSKRDSLRQLGVLKQKKSLQTSWPTGFHVFLWCLPFWRALLLLNKHRYYVDSRMGAAPFQARRLVESLNPSGAWLSMAQHGSAPGESRWIQVMWCLDRLDATICHGSAMLKCSKCSKCSKCVHVRSQARARAWAMAWHLKNLTMQDSHKMSFHVFSLPDIARECKIL